VIVSEYLRLIGEISVSLFADRAAIGEDVDHKFAGARKMSPDRTDFARSISPRRGICRAPGDNPLKFIGGIETLGTGWQTVTRAKFLGGARPWTDAEMRISEACRGYLGVNRNICRIR
jgi:hypothetical protein